MDSNRGIDISVLFSQLNCALEGAAVRVAGADIEHHRNAGVARPRNHFLAIGVVLGTIDMAMGINE